MSFIDVLMRNRAEIMAMAIEHLTLVTAALGIAVAIGIPLGIIVTRNARLGKLILGFTNVVQTVPSLALFGFLGTWNQYLWPNLVINEEDMNTVQSGLRLLSKANLDAPNLVMAGTVIAAIPIFAILFFFQRQLVRGLTTGAVKG